MIINNSPKILLAVGRQIIHCYLEPATKQQYVALCIFLRMLLYTIPPVEHHAAVSWNKICRDMSKRIHWKCHHHKKKCDKLMRKLKLHLVMKSSEHTTSS